MSVNAAIWFLWFYVLIYYCMASWVRFELARADPDYFEPGEETLGMKRATAIWNMLLDSDLPGSFGPKKVWNLHRPGDAYSLYTGFYIGFCHISGTL